jgi:hypothetical protein
LTMFEKWLLLCMNFVWGDEWFSSDIHLTDLVQKTSLRKPGKPKTLKKFWVFFVLTLLKQIGKEVMRFKLDSNLLKAVEWDGDTAQSVCVKWKYITQKLSASKW